LPKACFVLFFFFENDEAQEACEIHILCAYISISQRKN